MDGRRDGLRPESPDEVIGEYLHEMRNRANASLMRAVLAKETAAELMAVAAELCRRAQAARDARRGRQVA
jgi:hypothetical protein